MAVKILIAVVASLLVLNHNVIAKKIPTYENIKDMKKIISKGYDKNPAVFPTVLRLTFHDCVGIKCDACVNLEQGPNAGLKPAVDFLEDVYKNNHLISKFLSRSDLWSLAGIVAVEQGVKIANSKCTDPAQFMPDPDIQVMLGRKDCTTAPKESREFEYPNPEFDRRTLMDYYDRMFSFTPRQVTALLGAHVLGKASKQYSGYSGPWTANNASSFNTEFFRDLASKDVTFKNIANDPSSKTDKKFQFNMYSSSGEYLGMMLNTDIDLRYDIDASPTAGTKCRVNGVSHPKALNKHICPDAAPSSTDAVNLFATSPSAFMEEFRAVYERMLIHGNEGRLYPPADA